MVSSGRPPQFLRRVKNRPSLRRRSRLHAMIRAIGVVGGIVALAIGARLAWNEALGTDRLALQRVVLHQVPAMLIEPVRARLTPRYGQNLLSLDLREVRASVEALPAVRSASVRRVLPDGLVVSVQARRPVALVEASGRRWLVDDEGVVLGGPGARATGGSRLPRVRVVPGDDLHLEPGQRATALPGLGDRMAAALATVAWLGESGAGLDRPLDHLRVDGDGVVLVSGPPTLEVALGDATGLDAKIEAVRALLLAEPQEGPARVDARYRDMLVVEELEPESRKSR